LPINWNSTLPQSPRTALAWAAVCLATLVGAGWGLFSFGYTRGKDIGQDEASAYKAVSDAKLPEITAGLLAVNKDLREGLKIFDQNKKLEAENASYQQQLAEAAKARADLDVDMKGLRTELQTSADRETQLRNEIAKLNGSSRSFRLTANHSEQLGKGHSVGLVDSISGGELKIIQDNKETVMSAGNTIPVDFGDKQCVLALVTMEFSPASGDFDWSCETN
jgi:hypothetical protein